MGRNGFQCIHYAARPAAVMSSLLRKAALQPRRLLRGLKSGVKWDYVWVNVPPHLQPQSLRGTSVVGRRFHYPLRNPTFLTPCSREHRQTLPAPKAQKAAAAPPPLLSVASHCIASIYLILVFVFLLSSVRCCKNDSLSLLIKRCRR